MADSSPDLLRRSSVCENLFDTPTPPPRGSVPTSDVRRTGIRDEGYEGPSRSGGPLRRTTAFTPGLVGHPFGPSQCEPTGVPEAVLPVGTTFGSVRRVLGQEWTCVCSFTPMHSSVNPFPTWLPVVVTSRANPKVGESVKDRVLPVGILSFFVRLCTPPHPSPECNIWDLKTLSLFENGPSTVS